MRFKTTRIRVFSFNLWLFCVLHSAYAGVDQPPAINIVKLEQSVHQLINRERKHNGLNALRSNVNLSAIARSHSQDMISQQYFSHINLQGETPADRCKRQNWPVSKPLDSKSQAIGIAENLFLAHRYDKVVTTTENGVIVKKDYQWNSPDQIANTIVQGWMNSPRHRENLLSPLHDQQGIGIAISGNDVFVTDDLY
ncbi:MAG: CAP domain-containing protein [Methylococcaceae bacterium]|nr:CAP domain-containing protein [Methylococcaceae bacterium]